MGDTAVGKIQERARALTDSLESKGLGEAILDLFGKDSDDR
jgi:hypothetical protein